MSQIYFCAITWTPYSDPDSKEIDPTARAAFDMGSPWTLSCGLSPDLNVGTMSYPQFDLISDSLDQLGRIDLWFSNDVPDPNDESQAEPDVSIDNISIVQVKISQMGQPIGDQFRPVEYELTFADFRILFAEPRGGRLTLGLINQGPTPLDTTNGGTTDGGADTTATDPNAGPPEMSLSDLINACTLKMKTGADLPPDVDKLPAPREIKWFGNHAPTELKKLLEGTGLVFCPKLDGTATLEWITSTGNPTITGGGQQLPDAELTLLDRRGRYVVFSSHPTQKAITETTNGGNFVDGDYWEFVIQDSDNSWQAIDKAKILQRGGGENPNSKTPGYVTHIQQNFARIDPKLRDRVKSQLFSFIRLRTKYYDPAVSGVLQRMTESDLSDNDIHLTATIAFADPLTGLYANSPSDVTVPITHVAKGSILQVAAPLFQVKGACSNPWFNFSKASPFKVRYTVPAATTDPTTQKDVPTFYYVGFQRGANGFETIDDDTVLNIVNGQENDAIIIDRPELRFYTVDGKDVNADALKAKAQLLADSHLKDSSQSARQVRVVGYAQVNPSGLISQVQWSQTDVMTVANINDWFTAESLSMGHSTLHKKGNEQEDFPQQQKMQAPRQSIGEPAAIPSNAPATPVPPAPRTPTIRMVQIGSPKNCGGMYAGQILAQAPAFDPTQATFSLGNPTTNCVVVNLAEATKNTHILSSGAMLPFLDGVPQSDGTPTVMVYGGGYTGTQNIVTDVSWDGTNLKETKTPYEFTNGDLAKVDSPTTTTVDASTSCS